VLRRIQGQIRGHDSLADLRSFAHLYGNEALERNFHHHLVPFQLFLGVHAADFGLVFLGVSRQEGGGKREERGGSTASNARKE